MKLYYSKGACSLTVRIIMNELGIESRFESINLKNKKTELGTDFLSINPKGSVPVLELDDGRILTENAVILQYLADNYQGELLLPKVSDFKRYQVLEWLNFITTELHKGIGIFFNPKITQEMHDVLMPIAKQKLEFVSHALVGKEYLLGNEFTLPDAYLFVVLRWAPYLKIDLTPWPSLLTFIERMKSRESVQKALKAEGL